MPLLARDAPELQGGGGASTSVPHPRCGLRPLRGEAWAAPGPGLSPARSWTWPAATGLVELGPCGTFQVPAEGRGGEDAGSERRHARAVRVQHPPRGSPGSVVASRQLFCPKRAKLTQSWRRSARSSVECGVTAQVCCTVLSPQSPGRRGCILLGQTAAWSTQGEWFLCCPMSGSHGILLAPAPFAPPEGAKPLRRSMLLVPCKEQGLEQMLSWVIKASPRGAWHSQENITCVVRDIWKISGIKQANTAWADTSWERETPRSQQVFYVASQRPQHRNSRSTPAADEHRLSTGSGHRDSLTWVSHRGQRCLLLPGSWFNLQFYTAQEQL